MSNRDEAKEAGIQFPGEVTPPEILRNRLFDNNWPKTELEHFAKAEIDGLTAKNKAQVEEISKLKELISKLGSSWDDNYDSGIEDEYGGA